MLKEVFVTTSVYALAHQLGMQGALDEVKRQIDAPGRDSLPVVRTITRLRNLDVKTHLQVDGGATYIGMARSRAFHLAYESGLAWLALDDDIDVTTDTCAAMMKALDDVAPRIVLVPYLTRDEHNPRLTITLPMVRTERVRDGARLLLMPKGQGGGFGFVGMNRPALEAVHDFAEAQGSKLEWFDDGDRKLAVFYEVLEDGLWAGEDTSFFKHRVPDSVTVEALLVGTAVHGTVPLQLGSL